MPKRGRRVGSNATALQESSEPIATDAAKVLPESSTVSKSVETAATISPTESEIAIVAYQLWLDNGCPFGSDQEYWFWAEAMLKNALVAKYEDRSRRSSIPDCDIRTKSEMLVEFRWEGHWEVWESEWGGARWIWDLGHSKRRSFESSRVAGAVG